MIIYSVIIKINTRFTDTQQNTVIMDSLLSRVKCQEDNRANHIDGSKRFETCSVVEGEDFSKYYLT